MRRDLHVFDQRNCLCLRETAHFTERARPRNRDHHDASRQSFPLQGWNRHVKGVSLEELILRHALDMPIPSLQRERLAAGVMMIPIPGAGTFREVRGLAEAKAVPLIEDVQITAHPGERLVPFPEGSRYPGFIFARGETPDVVEAALRESFQRLTFVLE